MDITKGFVTYRTIKGDTFDSIALAAYDSEMMASHIIKVNTKYCDTIIFDEGIEIKIPVVEDSEIPESMPPWRR